MREKTDLLPRIYHIFQSQLLNSFQYNGYKCELMQRYAILMFELGINITIDHAQVIESL